MSACQVWIAARLARQSQELYCRTKTTITILLHQDRCIVSLKDSINHLLALLNHNEHTSELWKVLTGPRGCHVESSLHIWVAPASIISLCCEGPALFLFSESIVLSGEGIVWTVCFTLKYIIFKLKSIQMKP